MTASSPPAKSVPLVYVGGTGRGGSTLLSAALAMLPRVVSVGELRGIWQAVRLNELCGCGALFHDCPFWFHVGQRAFRGWDRVDVAAALAADATFCRHRSLPLLLAPALPRRRQAQLDQLIETLEKLYVATHDAAGTDTLILDSTKDAPYALLLRKIRAIDMRVIHLVRDSRAVAFSWARRVPRPEYAHIPELRHTSMDQMGPVRAAIEWDVRHVLFGALGRTGSETRLLSYEAFVAEPAKWVSHVARWLGLEVAGEAREVLSRGEYDSAPHHTLGGNRIRFERGRVPIRLDEEWLSTMSSRQRLVVTALTAPLLKRYGYALR